MECPICYENNVDGNGELLWLECLHPLCKRCLKKLERKVCPLCRHDIKSEVIEVITSKKKPVFTTVIRTENTLSIIDNLSAEIEETFENAVLHKAKRIRKVYTAKRENKKKGRWCNTARQTYGGRHMSGRRIHSR